MTWYSPLWEPKSRATLWASEVSSSCWISTLIPVRFLKGVRLAAIARVGAVFSEMKLMVVPLYAFHPSPPELAPDPPPQPAVASREAPARPAPVILRKPLREICLCIKNPLPRYHAAKPRPSPISAASIEPVTVHVNGVNGVGSPQARRPACQGRFVSEGNHPFPLRGCRTRMYPSTRRIDHRTSEGNSW